MSLSLYAQLLWSQCRQRGGCAGCCTKATQRRTCFKGHCGGGEIVETCGRGRYNLRGGILAVVKIHSSRHVCVMLIGIVVVPLYFTPHSIVFWKWENLPAHVPAAHFCSLFYRAWSTHIFSATFASCCFTAFDRFVSGRGLVLRKWTPWEGPPQFGENTLELRTIAILDVGICRLQLLCFHNVWKWACLALPFFGCRDAVFSLVRHWKWNKDVLWNGRGQNWKWERLASPFLALPHLVRCPLLPTAGW